MKIKSMLVNLLIIVGLSSCGMTTLSKRDSRFASIFGKELHVKKPIFLYEISQDLTGDSLRYAISSAEYGPEKVVGVLNVGHPVVFESVRTCRNLGAYSQALVGYTEYKSKRYPITYYIGMGGDDWEIGFTNFFSVR